MYFDPIPIPQTVLSINHYTAKMSSIAKKIVVFGGNGFLGKRICEAAVNRGYEVTSVSSSGSKPKKFQPMDARWISKVNWAKGNVFEKNSYLDIIQGSTAVVHSIGILLENTNYKKVVNSNDDLFNEIQSFFKTPNPMAKSVFNTYEKMNYESALVLAEALQETCVDQDVKPAMGYISADKGIPGLPSGYIDSKRKAEYELYQLQPGIRPIFMRPGFMYDANYGSEGKDLRGYLKDFLNLSNLVNDKLLGGALSSIVRPTISTQEVANILLNKIEDGDFHGVVSLDEMKGKRGIYTNP